MTINETPYTPAAPMPAAPVADSGRSGMATAALVLGICAAVFAFVPIIGMIAFVLGPLAIIFGILARNSAKRGQAIAGIATGGAGLAISILWMALFTAAVGGAANELSDYANCVDQATTSAAIAACAD